MIRPGGFRNEGVISMRRLQARKKIEVLLTAWHTRCAKTPINWSYVQILLKFIHGLVKLLQSGKWCQFYTQYSSNDRQIFFVACNIVPIAIDPLINLTLWYWTKRRPLNHVAKLHIPGIPKVCSSKINKTYFDPPKSKWRGGEQKQGKIKRVLIGAGETWPSDLAERV